jgi:predicted TPR repeat methyltransferase
MNEHLMQKAGQFHKAGQLDEAARLYSEIIDADPGHAPAQCSLGFVYMLQKRFAEAERHLIAAVMIEPRIFEAWNQLGAAAQFQGRFADSLNCLDRALGLEPGEVEALTNRASVLLELKRPEPALATLDTALAFRPDFVPALVNRGNALAQLRRTDEAIEAYDRALAIDPSNAAAGINRQNALLQKGAVTRCPPDFMQRLFDDFSASYDRQMLEDLKYRAHLHLRDLANRILPPKAAQRILDLGSGTGLVGEVFKDLARGGRLDGVDLSPRMNEEAKRRGIYDSLHLADLEDFLPAPGGRYDLILAADTMIYLGDLSPTFSGVEKRLAPDGHFLFAVEAKDGDDWEATKNNRFRHSLGYLKAEAARHGLKVIDSAECVLRNQGGVPVAGYAVAVRRA